MYLDKNQFRRYIKRTHSKAETCDGSKCVIANFLRDVKGFIAPTVDGETYDDSWDFSMTPEPLPGWAQKVVNRFDMLTNKGSDIIPAHRYRRSVLRALAA